MNHVNNVLGVYMEPYHGELLPNNHVPTTINSTPPNNMCPHTGNSLSVQKWLLSIQLDFSKSIAGNDRVLEGDYLREWHFKMISNIRRTCCTARRPIRPMKTNYSIIRGSLPQGLFLFNILHCYIPTPTTAPFNCFNINLSQINFLAPGKATSLL